MLTKMVNGAEVVMSAEEEAEIRAGWAASVPSAAEIKQQKIIAVEQANPITHRALRELILAIGSAYPSAQGTVFYQKAKTADDAVQAIKAAP